MNDVIIEIKMISGCYGLMARFYRGKEVIAETDLKHVLGEMNRISAKVNNEEKRACLFATR